MTVFLRLGILLAGLLFLPTITAGLDVFAANGSRPQNDRPRTMKNTGDDSPTGLVNPKKDGGHIVDRLLQKRILSGRAQLVDVRKALGTPSVGALTNTVHALYAMRWHRGVHTILLAMWRSSEKDHLDYPELAWDLILRPATRIAVAATLNRLYPGNPEYRKYIRAHANDAHEFHRAQVAIALGLNHDPADVKYLVRLVNEENHYVIQSAITALALMDEEAARLALVGLQKKYTSDPRGQLISEVLKRAYPPIIR
ncbi:MAG: HEAT repeat domain-containing protein [Candidatus Sedimenticola sp. (ex Thyasira tokunagai)]